MSQVKCDQCDEMFEMNVKVKKIGTDIKESYFDCPHCNHYYICYRTDSKIRKKQKNVREKIEKVKWVKDTDQFHKLQEEINQEKEQIKQMMDELKPK